LTEDIFASVAEKTLGTLRFEYDGLEIDMNPPWRRMTMYEALGELAGLEVTDMDDDEVAGILRRADLDNYSKFMARVGYNRGFFIAQLFDHFCQGRLIQPTFVIDYPRETVPLCKPHRLRPELIERFELFISGMEMANAYTELNDPLLQHKLFMEEAERGGGGDSEAHIFDVDFVEALRYGMPPTGGLGVGIDRLVMLLTGKTSIKEVILFPMMRRLSWGSDSLI
jgi:lysyl-tRNA synthetase class 2